MKIAIVGAGAVGCGLGAFLCRAGHNVTLVGRDRRIESLATGLKISGVLGEFSVRPTVVWQNPADALIDADFVFVTVKSFDTAAVMEHLLLANPDATIVHVQNGLGNFEVLAQQLDPGRIVTGMVIIGFRPVGSTQVEITVFGGPLRFGTYGQSPGPAAHAVVALFEKSGLAAQLAPRIDVTLWEKVLYNCALNPLGAILGVPYGELLRGTGPELLRQIVDEAVPLAGAMVPFAWDAAGYFRHLTDDLIPPTAGHRSSMLMDLENGRRTEIDSLNGALVRLGGQHGFRTPVNEHLRGQILFLEELAKSRAAQDGQGDGRGKSPRTGPID